MALDLNASDEEGGSEKNRLLPVSEWTIIKFERHHNRYDFDCGKHALNTHIVYNAPRDGVDWQTWVMLCPPNDTPVVAYYTISPDPGKLVADWQQFTEEDLQDGESHPPVYLEWIATDRRYARRGIGKIMLMHALRAVKKADDMHEVEGLLLKPWDDEARIWYERLAFGFIELPSGQLFLPIETIRELVSEFDQSEK